MTQTPPGERSWVGNQDPFLGNRCKPVTERRQGAGGQYATQRLDGHALVVADHVGAREAQGEVDVLLTLGARGSRRECRSGPRRRSWLVDTTALELGACVDGHLPGAIRDRLLGWQIHDRAAERDELLGSCDAGGQRRDQVRRFGADLATSARATTARTRSAPGPSASTASSATSKSRLPSSISGATLIATAAWRSAMAMPAKRPTSSSSSTLRATLARSQRPRRPRAARRRRCPRPGPPGDASRSPWPSRPGLPAASRRRRAAEGLRGRNLKPRDQRIEHLVGRGGVRQRGDVIVAKVSAERLQQVEHGHPIPALRPSASRSPSPVAAPAPRRTPPRRACERAMVPPSRCRTPRPLSPAPSVPGVCRPARPGPEVAPRGRRLRATRAARSATPWHRRRAAARPRRSPRLGRRVPRSPLAPRRAPGRVRARRRPRALGPGPTLGRPSGFQRVTDSPAVAQAPAQRDAVTTKERP